MIQKVFIRNVSLRFYAKSKFCVCFEVHIPVEQTKFIDIGTEYMKCVNKFWGEIY